jgi:hypothetical protein
MSWWLIPLIILDIIAGILAGLSLSYFIFKKKGKNYPLFKFLTPKIKSKKAVLLLKAGPPDKAENELEMAKSTEKEEPVSQIAEPVEPQVIPDNNAFIKELEDNLSVAARPAGDKLLKFQTEIWDLKQSEFQSAHVPFLAELDQLYVDMQLANNLVWLVADLGHDNPDFKAGYTDLKNRITLRLKRVIPKVKSLT